MVYTKYPEIRKAPYDVFDDETDDGVDISGEEDESE